MWINYYIVKTLEGAELSNTFLLMNVKTLMVFHNLKEKDIRLLKN